MRERVLKRAHARRLREAAITFSFSSIMSGQQQQRQQQQQQRRQQQPQPVTTNVKARFRINRADLLRSRLAELKSGKVTHDSTFVHVKHGHNFSVLKTSSFVYVVFPNARCSADHAWVNATKIATFRDVGTAVEMFCNIFGYDRHENVVGGIIVDNSTSAGTFQQQQQQQQQWLPPPPPPPPPILDLDKLRQFVNDEEGGWRAHARINARYPNRVVIRFQDLGSCICFASLKYIVVGARCRADVIMIFSLMKEVMRLMPPPTAGTRTLPFATCRTLQCAPTAASSSSNWSA